MRPHPRCRSTPVSVTSVTPLARVRRLPRRRTSPCDPELLVHCLDSEVDLAFRSSECGPREFPLDFRELLENEAMKSRHMGSYLSVLLFLVGMSAGVKAATADSGGCITRSDMSENPPILYCTPNECTTPGLKCKPSGNPAYFTCDCDGVYQVPFCELYHWVDPQAGPQPACNTVLCPEDCGDPQSDGYIVWCECS